MTTLPRLICVYRGEPGAMSIPRTKGGKNNNKIEPVSLIILKLLADLRRRFGAKARSDEESRLRLCLRICADSWRFQGPHRSIRLPAHEAYLYSWQPDISSACAVPYTMGHVGQASSNCCKHERLQKLEPFVFSFPKSFHQGSNPLWPLLWFSLVVGAASRPDE